MEKFIEMYSVVRMYIYDLDNTRMERRKGNQFYIIPGQGTCKEEEMTKFTDNDLQYISD